MTIRERWALTFFCERYLNMLDGYRGMFSDGSWRDAAIQTGLKMIFDANLHTAGTAQMEIEKRSGVDIPVYRLNLLSRGITAEIKLLPKEVT